MATKFITKNKKVFPVAFSTKIFKEPTIHLPSEQGKHEMNKTNARSIKEGKSLKLKIDKVKLKQEKEIESALNKSIKNHGLEQVGKFEREGSFIGGTKWFSFDSVTINGIKFDEKTDYYFTDVDAEGDELDKDGNFPIFKFKATGFIVIDDGDVQLFPANNVPLGRLDPEDLEDINGDKIITKVRR